MADPREDRAHLPAEEPESDKLLSESKLGAEQKEDVTGASEEEALSKSKLGGDADGGRKGQGGMRDPAKTSDPDKLKPS